MSVNMVKSYAPTASGLPTDPEWWANMPGKIPPLTERQRQLVDATKLSLDGHPDKLAELLPSAPYARAASIGDIADVEAIIGQRVPRTVAFGKAWEPSTLILRCELRRWVARGGRPSPRLTIRETSGDV